ncbi:hypothetical protein HOK51_11490 [Candidatus Woesearchaeota archaeon]|jgi:hypothetical protein|nr:hypothetical protein [Candidatus Woesearchaeota archaeon]MBT6520445.1 hypothetical protein [Candidatus Woesearchaeota archaeon]MBT7367339.1 hypothetical protein [Candidatus Woesearchaeota archaeon]
MKLYQPLTALILGIALVAGSAGCATTGCKYAPKHAMSNNPYSPTNPCYDSFEHQRGKHENIRSRSGEDHKDLNETKWEKL